MTCKRESLPAAWTQEMALNWIVFSPDGKYGCVSNTDSDDVSIFDVRERRALARVKVGKVPKRLVIGSEPKAQKSGPAKV